MPFILILISLFFLSGCSLSLREARESGFLKNSELLESQAVLFGKIKIINQQEELKKCLVTFLNGDNGNLIYNLENSNLVVITLDKISKEKENKISLTRISCGSGMENYSFGKHISLIVKPKQIIYFGDVEFDWKVSSTKSFLKKLIPLPLPLKFQMYEESDGDMESIKVADEFEENLSEIKTMNPFIMKMNVTTSIFKIN